MEGQKVKPQGVSALRPFAKNAQGDAVKPQIVLCRTTSSALLASRVLPSADARTPQCRLTGSCSTRLTTQINVLMHRNEHPEFFFYDQPDR